MFTGTVGKTTMRDTVSYVLKEFGLNVRSSNLGYTNELGIILSTFGIYNFSLLNLTDWINLFRANIADKSYVCIELGADFYYDIPWFLKYFKAHAVFISGIYDKPWSGDIDKIANQRRLLLESVKGDGIIVINQDDPGAAKLLTDSKINCEIKKISTNDGATSSDLILSNPKQDIKNYIEIGDDSYLEQIIVNTCNDEYTISFNQPILDAQLYAIGCAVIFVEMYYPQFKFEISQILNNWKFSNLRLNWSFAKGGAAILEDSYKSTPMCLNWIIDQVNTIDCRHKILVMSEMRPLSKSADKFYSNLQLKLNQFDDIFFAGDHNIYKKYFENEIRVRFVDTVEYEGLALSILKNCRKGDLIVVKGSEKYNLHYFVNKLTHE